MSSLSNPPTSYDALKIKAADQVVNNSAVLVADTELTFDAKANTTYYIEIFLNILSGTVPDFDCLLNAPSGAVGRIILDQITGIAQTHTPVRDITAEVGPGCEGVTDGTHNEYMHFIGIVKTSSTAGAVVIKWAQNTANASDTTLKAGSWMRYREA